MKRLLLVLLFASVAFAQNGAPQPCWGSDERCPDGKYRGRDEGSAVLVRETADSSPPSTGRPGSE